MRWLQRCCRRIQQDLLEAEIADQEDAPNRHPHLDEEALAAWMLQKE